MIFPKFTRVKGDVTFAEGVKLFEDIKNWAALAALAKRGAKPQDESSHPTTTVSQFSNFP